MFVHLCGASTEAESFPPPLCTASWPYPSTLSVRSDSIRACPPSASAAFLTTVDAGDWAKTCAVTMIISTQAQPLFRMVNLLQRSLLDIPVTWKPRHGLCLHNRAQN